MLAGLASAAAWFALFLLGHIIAFRLRPGLERSKLIVRLFSVAIVGHLAALVLIELALPHGLAKYSSTLAMSSICGVLLLLCLFVLYMPFYYTLNTSLSVETLAMLGTAPDGRLPLKQVEDRFTSIDFLRERLATMHANGYFEAQGDDRWRLAARGRRVARMFTRLKTLLGVGPGG